MMAYVLDIQREGESRTRLQNAVLDGLVTDVTQCYRSQNCRDNSKHVMEKEEQLMYLFTVSRTDSCCCDKEISQEKDKKKKRNKILSCPQQLQFNAVHSQVVFHTAAEHGEVAYLAEILEVCSPLPATPT